MRRLRPPALYAVLVALLLGLTLASLLAGRVWLPLSSWMADSSDPRSLILLELRLPRTLLALLVGAALGLSGAALQGYTRNPLADPGVLGVSATAALGAVCTLYFGSAAAAAWVTPAAAMAGAALGMAVLLLLSGAASSLVTFILAGAVLNVAAGAGVSLALSLAPDAWAVAEITNWLMGSLADRSRDDLLLGAPFILLGCAVLLTLGRGLDALTLGETTARSLGVDLSALRLRLAAGVALATGASVAVTGVIGFVGLITPHLLRPLVGARPGALLLPSAMAGAALTLAADIGVRLTPAAVELRLGVVMAAVGAPFFLVLLLVMRRRLA